MYSAAIGAPLPLVAATGANPAGGLQGQPATQQALASIVLHPAQPQVQVVLSQPIVPGSPPPMTAGGVAEVPPVALTAANVASGAAELPTAVATATVGVSSELFTLNWTALGFVVRNYAGLTLSAYTGHVRPVAYVLQA